MFALGIYISLPVYEKFEPSDSDPSMSSLAKAAMNPLCLEKCGFLSSLKANETTRFAVVGMKVCLLINKF